MPWYLTSSTSKRSFGRQTSPRFILTPLKDLFRGKLLWLSCSSYRRLRFEFGSATPTSRQDGSGSLELSFQSLGSCKLDDSRWPTVMLTSRSLEFLSSWPGVRLTCLSECHTEN